MPRLHQSWGPGGCWSFLVSVRQCLRLRLDYYSRIPQDYSIKILFSVTEPVAGQYTKNNVAGSGWVWVRFGWAFLKRWLWNRLGPRATESFASAALSCPSHIHPSLLADFIMPQQQTRTGIPLPNLKSLSGYYHHFHVNYWTASLAGLRRWQEETSIYRDFGCLLLACSLIILIWRLFIALSKCSVK